MAPVLHAESWICKWRIGVHQSKFAASLKGQISRYEWSVPIRKDTHTNLWVYHRESPQMFASAATLGGALQCHV